MKLKDIPKEELETMNYDDIAYIILNEEKKKMKINELFKKVCNSLELSENIFEEKVEIGNIEEINLNDINAKLNKSTKVFI